MTPGDRVAQLHPQALGTHYSRLLRHAWVTVGLFFNPGHHTGPFSLIYVAFLQAIQVMSLLLFSSLTLRLVGVTFVLYLYSFVYPGGTRYVLCASSSRLPSVLQGICLTLQFTNPAIVV
jgi:hypothetical protein